MEKKKRKDVSRAPRCKSRLLCLRTFSWVPILEIWYKNTKSSELQQFRWYSFSLPKKIMHKGQQHFLHLYMNGKGDYRSIKVEVTKPPVINSLTTPMKFSQNVWTCISHLRIFGSDDFSFSKRVNISGSSNVTTFQGVSGERTIGKRTAGTQATRQAKTDQGRGQRWSGEHHGPMANGLLSWWFLGGILKFEVHQVQ